MREREHPDSSGHRVVNRLLATMRRVAPRMKVIFAVAMSVALVFAIATLALMQSVITSRLKAERTNESYQECQRAANDLQSASDYLTSQARLYVATTDRIYLDNYLEELRNNDARGKALARIREHTPNVEAVSALEDARAFSDKLAKTELHALRLTAAASMLDPLPEALEDVELSEADAAALANAKRAHAHALMYGEDYISLKLSIRDKVQTCSSLLVESLQHDLASSNTYLVNLTAAMHFTVLLLLLDVAFVILSTSFLLLWPIALHEARIRDDKSLIPGGARELRTLTDAYNDIYNKNHDRAETLSYEADHDALTGLFNRGAFDELLTVHKHDSALMLVDVDYFKHFNDDYGHDMGDAILIEVAATLYASFRSTDHVCRIGGDEFAVIMVNVGPELRDVIAHKIGKVTAFLRDTSNGLPAVTISVGVAFGDGNCSDHELFRRADEALYSVKQRGRDGFAFHGED